MPACFTPYDSFVDLWYSWDNETTSLQSGSADSASLIRLCRHLAAQR